MIANAVKFGWNGDSKFCDTDELPKLALSHTIEIRVSYHADKHCVIVYHQAFTCVNAGEKPEDHNDKSQAYEDGFDNDSHVPLFVIAGTS